MTNSISLGPYAVSWSNFKPRFKPRSNFKPYAEHRFKVKPGLNHGLTAKKLDLLPSRFKSWTKSF